jgi:hypothetical protein
MPRAKPAHAAAIYGLVGAVAINDHVDQATVSLVAGAVETGVDDDLAAMRLVGSELDPAAVWSGSFDPHTTGDLRAPVEASERRDQERIDENRPERQDHAVQAERLRGLDGGVQNGRVVGRSVGGHAEIARGHEVWVTERELARARRVFQESTIALECLIQARGGSA